MKPISKIQFRYTSETTRPRMSVRGAVKAIIFIKKLKKSRKKTKHRFNVLNEWLNTQESYKNDISTAIECIKRPMLEQSLIDQKEAHILFPEFESMIQLSTMMLQVLVKAKKVKNPNHISIGNELLTFVSGYKIYGSFFKSHTDSEKILINLSKTREKQMREIQARMQDHVKKTQPKKQNMTIKDCMQQPLYRLFKYVLLIKEYIKKLPGNHRDYQTMSKAMNMFHEINNFNNDVMKKQEEENKKIKLEEFFGKTLDQSRTYIAEMQADTIYFRGKLYILNNLIIVTKLQSFLGSEKESRHLNIEIDEFSYVAKQDDLKYFKNILILVGTYECIHLLFPDPGSRMEVYNCLDKAIRNIKYRQHERKKIQDNQKKKEKKIVFTLKSDVNEVFKFQPEFRVQIVGVEVRPISTLSNDTVYITKFMIPLYYQDQVTFCNDEGLPLPHEYRQSYDRISHQQPEKAAKIIQRFNSLPFGVDIEDEKGLMGFNFHHEKNQEFMGLGQHLEIHFSLLEAIYKEIVEISPTDIPNINPITKDVNIYSQGKKKTKFFEMRKFFIEEFFNTIIKIEAVMHNPLWLIKKLRINEELWTYATTRNADIRKKGDKEADYGYGHCSICNKARIHSVEEFEHYRNYYSNRKSHRENKNSDRYCFNFYNLMRMKLLSFTYICFNNLERILLYYHNFKGRLDYPFIMHRCADTVLKVVEIYLPSLENKKLEVEIDSLSTVGEIVDELAQRYHIPCAFDFGLVVQYNGKARILDRDEFMNDVVAALRIKYEEIQEKNKRQVKQGIFEGIKKWGTELISSSDNRIFFTKVIYLHKSLEVKAFIKYPDKRVLEVEKVFHAVKRGMIRLTENETMDMIALYYCLQQYDKLSTFNPQKLAMKRIFEMIPDEHEHLLDHSENFKQNLTATIDRERMNLIKKKFDKSIIYSKVIDIVSNKVDYCTYYTPVQVRQIPKELLMKESMSKECLIGVNYKEFVVTRSQNSRRPIISLPLNDIEFFSTVYSLFITYDDKNLRFDSKLVSHFSHLMEEYHIISKKFPQHKA